MQLNGEMLVLPIPFMAAVMWESKCLTGLDKIRSNLHLPVKGVPVLFQIIALQMSGHNKFN
jgi:hypothetical protein